MKKFLALMAFALFPASSFPADPQEPNPFAVTVVVVPPAFPKGATLPPGVEVKIEVRGTISAQGDFKSPRFTHAPEHEDYAREVDAVLHFWRFMPAVSEQCAPKESEATLYVWFETKSGEPTVSVSMPSSPPAAKKARSLPFREPLRITYPREARRKFVEGTSVVLARVRKSGEIEGTEIRLRAVMKEFDEAALKGFERATLEPFDPAQWDGKETICAEYSVEYCLTGRGHTTIPNPKCRK
jgi:TonB family protein